MQKKVELFLVPIAALCGLVLAGAFYLGHRVGVANAVLLVTVVLGTAPLLWSMLKDLWRGVYSVDIIAVTAIIVSFFTHELLAGCVVVIMLSGGQALEFYAQARAREELTSLLAKVPTTAHVKSGGAVTDVPAEQVAVGDLLVVKPGEIFPVDGVVASGESDVDESSLTGESVPVQKGSASHVFSGTLNGAGVLEVHAAKSSAESRYAAIVKMVVAAQESKAPVVRLADRYAVFFTAVTFVLALGAWLASHDAVRLLAVLVVATPCPLILATPIALISGISRAASRGIIVKSGGSLEVLAGTRSFIFDKTGTLTFGSPKVTEVEVLGSGSAAREVVRLGASIDQLSATCSRCTGGHANRDAGWSLTYPKVQRVHGRWRDSVTSTARRTFLASSASSRPRRGNSQRVERGHERQPGNWRNSSVPGIWGQLSRRSALLRRNQARGSFTLQVDSRCGYSKGGDADGDKENVAAKVAKALGIHEYHADCKPEDKVAYVKELQGAKHAEPGTCCHGGGWHQRCARAGNC